MDIYILSEKKFDGAKNLPVILIKFLDKKIDLSCFDALIFTSKNGVKAIDRIDKSWKNKEIYSIGEGTTKAIEELGAKACYTAKSSYGDNFAAEIKERLKDKKVLFLRPKTVTSSLNLILRNEKIDLSEEIVYETVCAECSSLEPPSEGSVIIFSSPSTVECFLKCFKWKESYKAVAIGEKTASYIPSFIKYQLSLKQTIPACIELAKRLTLISQQNSPH